MARRACLAPRCRARPAVDARHRQRWQGPGRLRAGRLAAETRALTRKILLRLFLVWHARRASRATRNRACSPPRGPPARAAAGICHRCRTMPACANVATRCGRRPARPGLSARPRRRQARRGPWRWRWRSAVRSRATATPVQRARFWPKSVRARPTDRPAPAGRPPARCGFPERARFQDLAAEVGGIHAMPGHGLEGRLDLGNGEFVVQQMRDDGRIGRLRAQLRGQRDQAVVVERQRRQRLDIVQRDAAVVRQRLQRVGGMQRQVHHRRGPAARIARGAGLGAGLLQMGRLEAQLSRSTRRAVWSVSASASTRT